MRSQSELAEEIWEIFVLLCTSMFCVVYFQALQPYLSVCIPHVAPRVTPGREVVVRVRAGGGGWKDVPTHEVHFDDIKVGIKTIHHSQWINDCEINFLIENRPKSHICIIHMDSTKL